MAQGTAPLASCGKPGLCLLEYLDHSQRPLALHSEVVLFVFFSKPRFRKPNGNVYLGQVLAQSHLPGPCPNLGRLCDFPVPWAAVRTF